MNDDQESPDRIALRQIVLATVLKTEDVRTLTAVFEAVRKIARDALAAQPPDEIEKACRAMNECGLGEHGCSQASELADFEAWLASENLCLGGRNSESAIRFLMSKSWQAARAKNETLINAVKRLLAIHPDAKFYGARLEHQLDGLLTLVEMRYEHIAARAKNAAIQEKLSPSEITSVTSKSAERKDDVAGASKVVTNGWRPVETAPRDARILAVVDGVVRFCRWGKTSHVPIHGFCLADQGAEDLDLCNPTHWMPLPAPPEALSASDQSPEAPETDKQEKSYAQGRADEAEQREADARDAERWRATRDLYIGFDWEYGPDKQSVILLRNPGGAMRGGPIGADAWADAALQATKPQGDGS